MRCSHLCFDCGLSHDVRGQVCCLSALKEFAISEHFGFWGFLISSTLIKESFKTSGERRNRLSGFKAEEMKSDPYLTLCNS